MPEMHFTIEWPNGRRERCYSPSYVVEEYLSADAAYPVREFLERVTLALEIASERVRQRYGFACSSALEQLRELERSAAELSTDELEGAVKIVVLEKHAARDARAGTEGSRQ
jgi:uncharacterized repeat protein (TIGR04042 family)